jgi:bifunctional non-homologous end joining protein LigD
MSRVTKSKKQYVQSINTPAKLYAAKLPETKGAPFPGYIEPLFATKVDRVPSADNWVHEIKFDGYAATGASKGQHHTLLHRARARLEF